MYKSKFTLSDDHEEFEGYTDGSLWNGWANVCFSREQLIEMMKSMPYDFKFSSNGGIPQVTIWWEKDEPETAHQTAILRSPPAGPVGPRDHRDRQADR